MRCGWGAGEQEQSGGMPLEEVGKRMGMKRELDNPGIEPGSPALQEDSLPTELSGKP